jgi:hypothetical protein
MQILRQVCFLFCLHEKARPTDAPPSTTPSPPSGRMTRVRAKLLQAKVNSLLSSCDFDLPLDGLLLHATTLCILSYEATLPHQAPKEGPGGDTAGALHTGISGVHRSLRSCTPESPDHLLVRPQEPSQGQSEGPSGDGSGD